MSETATNQVLAGQRAVISGASRGIGQGIAVELCKAGAEVLVADLNPADETAELCKPWGGVVHYRRTDVSKAGDVAALMSEAVDKMGGIDIVVSNAAYSDRHAMLESDLGEFHKTIDVSMWGAFYMVRFGAEKLVEAERGGNIVVVSSPHAHMPIPGAMAYNMAKAANDQTAKTAAVELADHNIRVNLIHPGWIDTPGEKKFFSGDALAAGKEKIPMGRLGQPRDLGRGVVFLCDPASDYITGSTLTIDGGIQLPWHEMHRLRNP
ncbi:MAG: SDR family oxidoreductase [Planctomycetota bacterium]